MSNKFQELSDFLLALFNADGDEALELIEKLQTGKISIPTKDEILTAGKGIL